MIFWQDDTDGNKKKRTGESDLFVLKANGFRVVLHRVIGLEGWFVSCYGLNVEKRELESEELEDAKKEALELIDGIAAVEISKLVNLRTQFEMEGVGK
ncbi:hypothetical protein NIE88_18655 [Sporolactobacillus shoreicorticis]|uniref:Uncharacterized protein n=1 Tax=Sporolactobacillus shoreicorticis TaxID=1923877 RepID=A0ABW5S7N4_9BACL|nr:hypothetical protein [Sporolactobacillus shoreicorticis]MCO7127770.1 hypothetical protein [Sporolactobacillus shoreicorticis]